MTKIKKRPVLAAAPMDGYTDFAFREILKKYSNPDVIFTEFVHATALVVATKNILNTLRFSEAQRPIVAQLFGDNPEMFYKSAQILLYLGFDGIDINMGCPAKNVYSSGGGSALIKNKILAFEIIKAVQNAKNDFMKGKIEIPGKIIKMLDDKKMLWKVKKQDLTNITVSVKTRLGYEKFELNEWIIPLSKSKIDFLTIHGRTYKQKFTGHADWEKIAKAVQKTKIFIFANGDVKKYSDIKKISNQTNAGGVMVGRALVGNPYFFKQKSGKISINDQKKAAIQQAEIFAQTTEKKEIYDLRKHMVCYFKSMENASKLRSRLVTICSVDDLKNILSTL